MYAQCTQCPAVFRLQAENLRLAMGMVRCTQCGTVFNALSTIRDEPPAEVPVHTLGSQIHYVQMGDRIVMDPTSPLVQTMTALLRDISAKAPEAPPLAAPPPPAAEAAPPEAAEEPGQDTQAQRIRILPADLMLALRNLLRQRRRTTLAVLAIGFGVIALLLAGGFMEWIFWAMRESTIQSRLGHIQVMRQGYLENGTADPYAYLLPADEPVAGELEGLPEVRAVAPRLSFTGLASFGENTVSFIGEGVDPVKEEAVSKYLVIRDGEGLSAEDPTGIVLGSGLATNLGVKPGDTITLLASTSTGGLNAVEARVAGIFYTSTQAYDDSALRVPIGMARELLRVDGAHTLIVLLEDTAQTDRVLSGLRDRHGTASGLQFVPWTDLADFYKKTVTLFTRQLHVVRVIIGFIIVLSISNLLVMSVLDRTSEIGTLMALGLRQRRIMRLFLGEGLLLGLMGSVAGVAIGWGLGEAISAVGIPMPPPPGMEKGFTGEIMVTWQLAAGAFLLALVTTTLAGVYPAWKASRLNIVDALRHSR